MKSTLVRVGAGVCMGATGSALGFTMDWRFIALIFFFSIYNGIADLILGE